MSVVEDLLGFLGLTPSTPAAPSAASPTKSTHAPIPQSQTEGGAARAIPGSMIPIPPLHTRAEIVAFVKQTANTPDITHMVEGASLLPVLALLFKMPWPDATGLWRAADANGQDGHLWQFHDCQGNKIGHPGYMPLSVKARYDGGVGCHGEPHPFPPNLDPVTMGAQFAANAAAADGGDASSASDAGAVAGQVVATAAQAVGAAGTMATTVSGIAGAAAAASSGAGAAGAVAAGIGSALCCLGPTPLFAEPLRMDAFAPNRHATWLSAQHRALIVDGGDRLLGVSLFRDGGGAVTIAAIEVEAPKAGESLRDMLLHFYEAHAHRVIDTVPTLEEAEQRAEAYGAAWRNGRLRDAPDTEPCPCPEIEGTV